MNQERIKQIAKQAVDSGYLTPDVAKREIRQYKQAVHDGTRQTFPAYLQNKNLITARQKNELESLGEASRSAGSSGSAPSPNPQTGTPSQGNPPSNARSSPSSGPKSPASSPGNSGPDSSRSGQPPQQAPAGNRRPRGRSGGDNERGESARKAEYRKSRRQSKSTLQLVIGASVGLVILSGLVFYMFLSQSRNDKAGSDQPETVNPVTYRNYLGQVESKYAHHDHAEAERLLKEKIRPVADRLPEELTSRLENISKKLKTYRKRRTTFVKKYRETFKNPLQDLPEDASERFTRLTTISDRVNTFEYQFQDLMQQHPHLQSIKVFKQPNKDDGSGNTSATAEKQTNEDSKKNSSNGDGTRKSTSEKNGDKTAESDADETSSNPDPAQKTAPEQASESSEQAASDETSDPQKPTSDEPQKDRTTEKAWVDDWRKMTVGKQIKELRKEIKSRKKEIYAPLYESVRKEIVSLLDAGKYKRARRRAVTFRDAYSAEFLTPAPSTIMNVVSSRIETDLQPVLQKVESLREEEKWEAALSTLRSAKKKFGEKNVPNTIDRKITTLKREKRQAQYRIDEPSDDDATGNGPPSFDGDNQNEKQGESSESDPDDTDNDDGDGGSKQFQRFHSDGRPAASHSEGSIRLTSRRQGALRTGTSTVVPRPQARNRIPSARPPSHTPPTPLRIGNPPDTKSTNKETSTFNKKKTKEQIMKLGRKYAAGGQLSIESRGAIRGNRTMKNMWKLKTRHYVVHTDVSKRAAGEVALFMEMLYYSFIQFPIFEFNPENFQRLHVILFKNRREFKKFNPKVPAKARGYYFRKGNKQALVTYYMVSKHYRITKTLLHEGTHQFIDNVTKSDIPIWLNEGLATYFEASRFRENLTLKQGVINKSRLRTIQRMIRHQEQTKKTVLETFSNLMRMTDKNFSGRHYSQAWSLVHFLVHARNNHFLPQIRKYFRTYKKPNVRKNPVKLFRDIFGFPPRKLRRFWRAYVMNLSK